MRREGGPRWALVGRIKAQLRADNCASTFRRANSVDIRARDLTVVHHVLQNFPWDLGNVRRVEAIQMPQRVRTNTGEPDALASLAEHLVHRRQCERVAVVFALPLLEKEIWMSQTATKE